MQSEVVNMTPKWAAELLAADADAWPEGMQNRAFKPANEAYLVSEIKAGRWKLNAETVKMNCNGAILDGQHRLSAIVKSGVTVPLLLVTGLDVDVLSTIDRGAIRTTADWLSMHGEMNANVLAAAATIVDRIRRAKGWRGSKEFSPGAVAGILEANPGLRDSVALTTRAEFRQPVISRAASAALHYLFSEIDSEAATQFFVDLARGANLPPGDPVLVLRERSLSAKLRGESLSREELTALAIKSWNARRIGKTIKVLRFNRGEEFPAIL